MQAVAEALAFGGFSLWQASQSIPAFLWFSPKRRTSAGKVKEE
jgi:hypothetical protein